jgi:hypothetical protein
MHARTGGGVRTVTLGDLMPLAYAVRSAQKEKKSYYGQREEGKEEGKRERFYLLLFGLCTFLGVIVLHSGRGVLLFILPRPLSLSWCLRLCLSLFFSSVILV